MLDKRVAFVGYGVMAEAMIAGQLRHAAVVHSMPNTPAQIGEGITVWTASEAVNVDQKEIARAVWAAYERSLEPGREAPSHVPRSLPVEEP